MELIISLIAGALGGNAAGSLMKNLSLGPIGNSIVGILGGGLGAQLLNTLGAGGVAGAGGLDIGTIISQLASGGVGGGVLLAIVGLIKSMISK
jgi:uncharacterized membrane protein YeaQ/YmgE (transglycosylase-associated protein family)